ncbi:MAG: 30S ribosomal protein S2 [Clostridia bacterium]|nr:30S ribosomal protein S2 [Clostridia bacterium]MBR2052901.1 30S ribosomal protein S2 [Clostridia bacterium]MBR2220617.1 30S ribosomal protein S2 [Clostridia bacterium]
MSVISMKQLLEAGCHFGHQSKKWNPKMKPFIFTARNNIHIINLEETSAQVDKAYEFIKTCAQGNGTVLFVGTKKQAQEVVKEEATRAGMFYVNTRWLGGTLTNFKTIKSSIERLNKLNQAEKVGEFDLLPKKEATLLRAQRDKLEKNLGGIKDMHTLPSVIFVVDPTVERICVREANALNIPVVAIVDTNSDPSNIECVIPANDDAVRSVKLITSALADAVIEAKEGVSPKLAAEVEEEMVDIKTVLDKTVPNLELAESEDEPAKKRKKKPAKKPVAKAEKPAEAAEKPAENKEEK